VPLTIQFDAFSMRKHPQTIKKVVPDTKKAVLFHAKEVSERCQACPDKCQGAKFFVDAHPDNAKAPLFFASGVVEHASGSIRFLSARVSFVDGVPDFCHLAVSYGYDASF